MMRFRGRFLVWVGAVLALSAPAAAQGPLTADLPEGDLPVVSYYLGPFSIAPNIAVRDVGIDTNVFDETEDPKRDWTGTVSPSMTALMRAGLFRFVFNTSSDFVYYHKYKSERALTRALRGRLDFLLSRFRPWVGAALIDTRGRPNPEIDLRARREEDEVSAGLAFTVTPIAQVALSADRVDIGYLDGEVFQGIDLEEALSHRTESARMGLRVQATPFTTVTVEGGVSRDVFASAPVRNSESRLGAVELGFSRDAVVTGRFRIGYRDFRPDDPTLRTFRGVTARVGLSSTTFWRGRFEAAFERDVLYSFEETEGYFVSNGLDATYTQRVFGPIDVQARYGRGLLEYGARAETGARQDDTLVYSGGIGYNRNNGARLGLTYEYAERTSDERPDRRYTRRRIYTSYTFRFDR